MKVLPESTSQWFSLALLPFKVFVPSGYLMLAIERTVLGYRRDTGVMAPFVVSCYMLTFFVLVIGAMLQHRFCSRSAYLSTCWFILALFIFGWLSLSYLAHS